MNSLFPRDVVFSIKPRFVDLIKSREKTHEFRNYVPKSGVRFIYIYVTSPVAEIKYIAEVSRPIEYPAKIPEAGFGNVDFNTGLKKSKLAFLILHLEELIGGVSLSTMREKLNVNPPQSFFYLDTAPELEKYINGLRRKNIY